MDRPNILYIHSHDTGRNIRPFVHAVSTPNLQQLAEEGILFRKCFSAAPTCSPSRAALLTGQYPHSSGMLGLAHRGFSLDDYNQHIVHTLNEAGYFTQLIGHQHVAKDPEEIGYDDIKEHLGGSRSVVEAAKAFIHNAPEPFFLSVGFFETHRPFPRPQTENDEKYSKPPSVLPDTPATRADIASFMASVRILDRAIGDIVQTLTDEGLTKRTLVICTTDHGIAFPGMKCTLTDHGIGVFLIMRGSEDFAGGRVVDAMVSQIDLFPTICELLDLEKPPWLQGISLLPIIRGEVEEVREELFAEVTFHAAYEPQRAVRTQRWKYIRRFDDRSVPVLPNIDDGPSKDVWMDKGFKEREVDQEQLFDLHFDPNEVQNLVYDPEYADILKDLRFRLQCWMEETHDPLINGPVTPPPGSEINDVDGISPDEPPRLFQ
ncbi:MAG: sulfatase-like hydrolase/transferase [Anaerolineales bacterium]|nr:sulfatase-like hydrolase/transferase [Anaerolineales bacterium]